MKKTVYTVMVRDSYCYGAPIYRRVWVDANGDYFVKFEGKVLNVNHIRHGFVAD